MDRRRRRGVPSVSPRRVGGGVFARCPALRSAYTGASRIVRAVPVDVCHSRLRQAMGPEKFSMLSLNSVQNQGSRYRGRKGQGEAETVSPFLVGRRSDNCNPDQRKIH